MPVYYMSSVESVDRLAIDPIPARPTKVEKMVRVGNKIVAVTAKGKVYANLRVNNASYTASTIDEHLFQALVKLGVVPKADMDAHIAAAEKIRNRRDDRWAAENLVEGAKRSGIPLTKRQRTWIEELDVDPDTGKRITIKSKGESL